MKRCGLWVTHKLYRNRYGKSLAEDLCSMDRDLVEKRIRMSTMFDNTKIKDLVEACAIRYCRIYKINKARDWDNLVLRIAGFVSGNPKHTAKSLYLGQARPKARLIFLNGEARTQFYDYQVFARLKRFKEFLLQNQELRRKRNYENYLYLQKMRKEVIEINKLIVNLKEEMKNGKHHGKCA